MQFNVSRASRRFPRAAVLFAFPLLPATLPATNVEGPPKILISPASSDGAITVSIATAISAVQGWSFGICHDPEKARIARFGSSAELATLNDGQPPFFYSSERASLVDGEGRRLEGLVQAVVIDQDSPLTLPVSTEGFPVLKVEYRVFEETSIAICGGLRGRGMPVNALLSMHGRSVQPELGTANLLPKPYAAQLAWRVEPPQSSGVVSVVLASTGVPVEGWSFAICSTAGAAEVQELASSWEVQTIRDGEPPEFMMNVISSGATFLAVRQSVILGRGFDVPLAMGPFPEGLKVCDIRYRVLSEADDLKFCDRLDGLELDNRVSVDGVQYLPATRIGGSLVRGGLGTRFVRGDADLNGTVDISDPIITLASLFLGGDPLPCLNAADSNGAGSTVDISDPIFTLHFLFLGGPAPPLPFPEPGEALGRSLGCERGL